MQAIRINRPRDAVRWLLAVVLGLSMTLVAGPAFAADRSDLIDPDSITITATSGNQEDPLVQYNQVDVSFAFSSQGQG